jgi:hypothetical protein
VKRLAFTPDAAAIVRLAHQVVKQQSPKSRAPHAFWLIGLTILFDRPRPGPPLLPLLISFCAGPSVETSAEPRCDGCGGAFQPSPAGIDGEEAADGGKCDGGPGRRLSEQRRVGMGTRYNAGYAGSAEPMSGGHDSLRPPLARSFPLLTAFRCPGCSKSSTNGEIPMPAWPVFLPTATNC